MKLFSALFMLCAIIVVFLKAPERPPPTLELQQVATLSVNESLQTITIPFVISVREVTCEVPDSAPWTISKTSDYILGVAEFAPTFSLTKYETVDPLLKCPPSVLERLRTNQKLTKDFKVNKQNSNYAYPLSADRQVASRQFFDSFIS